MKIFHLGSNPDANNIQRQARNKRSNSMTPFTPMVESWQRNRNLSNSFTLTITPTFRLHVSIQRRLIHVIEELRQVYFQTFQNLLNFYERDRNNSDKATRSTSSRASGMINVVSGGHFSAPALAALENVLFIVCNLN